MFEELVIQGYSTARIYDEVSSTMDVARTLLDLPGAGVVVARRQSAGRGRQGRSWSSSESAFMGTFIFGTELPMFTLSGYSLAVGVAIAEAIGLLGGALQLKWPNDLVVVAGGELHKLGGILIEVEERSTHRAVLVGLGLNISDAPSDIANASSLRRAFGIEVSLSRVLSSLAVTLLDAHRSFCAGGGFQAFHKRWIDRSCFVVDRSSVTIDLGREVLSGTFRGVESNGALVLRSDGVDRIVHSGHVLQWCL
jgi:BirA family biotin operon repressor/biotin-[acetyl-CoA-carboxylase] ligase